MRALVLMMAMVAARGLAVAQQATYTVIPAGMGCPVGFTAEVSARAVMHSVEEEKRYGSAPALELRFAPGPEQRVVRASVSVYGLPLGSRVVEVSGKDDGATSERFELVAAMGLGAREVRVKKLAVVRWAEVTEMRYADGTTWRPVKGERCRAVPSLFREVGAVGDRR